MTTNRQSHVDLYCCMSQITRFYRNQYIYFAHKISGIYGYSRQTLSSSGKAKKTWDFSWQTFVSFVKKKQQIFWWVTDVFIVENSPDKLVYRPDMTRPWHPTSVLGYTELLLKLIRPNEAIEKGSVMGTAQRQGHGLGCFPLVTSTSIYFLSRIFVQHLELCNNFWIKTFTEFQIYFLFSEIKPN